MLHVMKHMSAPVLLALLATTAPARSAQWATDYANSRLGFVATYEGVGFDTRFETFTADIDFDAGDPGSGRFEVVVQISSVNSRSKDRDEGMLDADWFDSAAHPTARFETTAFEQLGPGRFQAMGNLTLKGVTRSIMLPFSWEQDGDGARLSAETTLERTSFDIGSGEWANDNTIGFKVKVVADLVLSP
jgi:polyisoprenoid-binding protein YceI